MSLERVELADVQADILNIGVLGLIPSAILAREVDDWYRIINEKDTPVEHAGRQLAVVLHEETADNYKFGVKLEAIAEQGLFDPDDTEVIESALRMISARMAISRLMKQVVEQGDSYTAVGDELSAEDEAADRAFLDQEYREDPPIGGAHSLVVPRRVMADTPYFTTVVPFEGPDDWYADTDSGLYVRAQTPATVSRGLMDGLTVCAAGNRERAVAFIDAPNAATLFPYMSNSHVLASL